MSTKNFLLVDKTDHLCDNGIMKKKPAIKPIKPIKPHRYKTIKRIMFVTGTLWSGPDSSYPYVLKQDQDPKNLAEAKKIAGDFQGIDSAVILTTKSVHTTTRNFLPLPLPV